jgi:hypothetical protein
MSRPAKKRQVFEVIPSDDEPVLLPSSDDAGLHPVDWDEFWGKPAEPVRYLVAPLLAEGEITRVYSQAKVGKSLLIQECAAALATGRQVLGQDVEPVPVVYIDQENTEADWKTRLTDMGYGPDDDFALFHWYSLQPWPPLDTAAGGALVVATVEKHHARLVVIDTQSKMLHGEEDKQPTQQAFYQHTLIPLKRLGVSVVIIDHAGNDPTKPRGSSGKRDDVDTVWRVSDPMKNRLLLDRTHHRRAHDVDRLFIDRLLDPLRHLPTDAADKDEHALAQCVVAIRGLDPQPSQDTSARQVIRLLREADHRFREATVRTAWKRVQEAADEDG